MDNQERNELANKYVELVDKKNLITDQLEALRAIINHLITDNSTDIVKVEVLKVMKLSEAITNPPEIISTNKHSGFGFFQMMMASLANESVYKTKLEVEFSDGDAITVMDCLIKVKKQQLEAIEAEINKIDLDIC